MTTPARKRLMRDFRRLQNDPPSGVQGAPMDNDIMVWQAVIFGPDDTPWEGGNFRLLLEFTEDYPNKPPMVSFVTKMFHPNIYSDGKICLDILQSQWSPIYDIGAILTSIQSLLSDPNPASPANGEASQIFENDRREYNRRVKEVVESSWVVEDEGEEEEEDDEEVAVGEVECSADGGGGDSTTGASTVFNLTENNGA